MRAPAIHLLRHCLINTDRQYQFTRQLIGLYLFEQPREFAQLRVGKKFRIDIIQSERKLLVFLVLVIVTP